jgi:hypothetical protein
MPTTDDDLTLLLVNVAGLIRTIFDAPADEWRRRANDLADALDNLAGTNPHRHPRPPQ